MGKDSPTPPPLEQTPSSMMQEMPAKPLAQTGFQEEKELR